MSLYGLERRTNFSPFQFDKIYSSRLQMEHCDVIITENNYTDYNRDSTKNVNDGIYIGRYILISYGEDDFTKDIDSFNETQATPLFVTTPNANSFNNFDYDNNEHSIDISTQTLEFENIIATKSNEQFQLNLHIDLETYGNSYHNTVWMKVYRNGKEEYIMIAELNAKAPQLGIEVTNPAIKSYTGAGNGIVGKDTTETWQEPYFDLSKSTDLYYTLQMPKTLRYFTKKPDFKSDGFNYKKRNQSLDDENDIIKNLNSDNNKVQWQYGNTDNQEKFNSVNDNEGTNISAKQLQIELPALGQIASLLYDILFGIPSDPGGIRPGAEDNAINLIQSVLGNDLGNPNNGLLLLLHGIFENGNWQPDWKKSIAYSGSIKNKPKVIYNDNSQPGDNGDRQLNLAATSVYPTH